MELIRALRRQDAGTRTRRPASSPAATCRRSSWRASSRASPRILVAAAPTRGLDVGAIETVHEYLREAAAAGVAVLLISEDLDEVLTLSDRIAVMYEGAIVGEVDARAATRDEIGLLMAGIGASDEPAAGADREAAPTAPVADGRRPARLARRRARPAIAILLVGDGPLPADDLPAAVRRRVSPTTER